MYCFYRYKQVIKQVNSFIMPAELKH